MTQKLNETFGFTEEDIPEGATPDIVDNSEGEVIPSTEDMMTIESGIHEHEKEMNEIYNIALKAHKDTILVGLTVDPKNASPGLSASTSYLDIALKASRSKVDKKMALLRMKTSLLNVPTKPKEVDPVSGLEVDPDDAPEHVEGGVLMDRNKLLEEINSNTTKDVNKE